jgi:hypothetical protein
VETIVSDELRVAMNRFNRAPEAEASGDA